VGAGSWNAVKANLHGATQPTMPGTHVAQPPATTAPPVSSPEEDIMGKIRQLGELHQAGILSDEEFVTKKAELLARL
jgi:hypothetical protein